MSEDYNEKLREARQEDSGQSKNGNASATDTAKNLTKAATPMGFFSVLKKIDFSKDIPFFCAFGFAILKDILDIVFTGTGGLIPLSMLFSILCSIFIFMMLLLAGSSGKKGMASGLLKKGGFLIGGGVVDAMPGVGMFPAETATVGVIYCMTLSER